MRKECELREMRAKRRGPLPGFDTIEGWLGDDDPFFETMDEIVANRSLHVPRVLGDQEIGEETEDHLE